MIGPDPKKPAEEILLYVLHIISEWANQWKMSFNPDPTKPAEEILFSQKSSKTNHPPYISMELRSNL